MRQRQPTLLSTIENELYLMGLSKKYIQSVNLFITYDDFVADRCADENSSENVMLVVNQIEIG